MQQQAKSWRQLELQIEDALDEINRYSESVFGIRLEVRQARRKSGEFICCKRQPFDYAIIMPAGQPSWFFDAKECSGEKWYASSNSAEHQRAALQKMQHMGHRAGFLVYFKYSLALRFIEDWSRAVTADSGVAFDWQMFF